MSAGSAFDEVARQFSEDKARQGEKEPQSNSLSLDKHAHICAGGALGWKTRGGLDPAFEAVAFELEASTVNKPKYAEAKSSFGYHIIMVEGRK